MFNTKISVLTPFTTLKLLTLVLSIFALIACSKSTVILEGNSTNTGAGTNTGIGTNTGTNTGTGTGTNTGNGGGGSNPTTTGSNSGNGAGGTGTGSNPIIAPAFTPSTMNVCPDTGQQNITVSFDYISLQQFQQQYNGPTAIPTRQPLLDGTKCQAHLDGGDIRNFTLSNIITIAPYVNLTLSQMGVTEQEFRRMYLTCQDSNGTTHFAFYSNDNPMPPMPRGFYFAQINTTDIGKKNINTNIYDPNLPPMNTLSLVINESVSCNEVTNMQCGLSKNGVELIPKQPITYSQTHLIAFSFDITNVTLLYGDNITFNCITNSHKNININRFLLNSGFLIEL